MTRTGLLVVFTCLIATVSLTACSPDPALESPVENLTLTFDELTPYGDYLRMETTKIDIDPGDPDDNERAIAELSVNFDPPGAWVLRSRAGEIWRAAPTPPRAATTVSAVLGSPLEVSQTVYEFDRPEDAQAMRDSVADARAKYPTFTRTVENGYSHTYTPSDRADQLDDHDVLAYGLTTVTWEVFVVSGNHLLRITIDDDRDFDAVGLINQAIAKFRAATT